MPENNEQAAELKRIAARMRGALPPGTYWEYIDNDKKSDIWIVAPLPLDEAGEHRVLQSVEKARIDFISDSVKLNPQLRYYGIPIGRQGTVLDEFKSMALCNHGHDNRKACYFGLRPETMTHIPAMDEALREAFGPPGPVPVPSSEHAGGHGEKRDTAPPSARDAQSPPRDKRNPPRDTPTPPREKPNPLVDAARLKELSSNYVTSVLAVRQRLRAETARAPHAGRLGRTPTEREVMDMLDLQIDMQKNATRGILARLKMASTQKIGTPLPPLTPLDNLRLQPPGLSEQVQGRLREACVAAQKCSDEYVAALEEMSAALDTSCKYSDGVAAVKIVNQALSRNVRAISSGRGK